MFSIEILVACSIVMFIIGAIIGIAIGRSWIPPEQQKALETRLSTAKQELDGYQEDVARHFLETSRYVSELTQSYKDLHEHLAKGALNLTSSEIGRKVLVAGDATQEINLENSKVEAPKDWAPPRDTLREDFGLEGQEDTPVVPIPAKPASDSK